MKRGLILGFFDGVHTAHQAVIKSALDYAGEAMLITFKDSPAKYFNQEAEYIYTRKQSLKKIMSLGVSGVVELNFAEIANTLIWRFLWVFRNRMSISARSAK